jgi:DNA-binding CsgD family transcriptional regulator
MTNTEDAEHIGTNELREEIIGLKAQIKMLKEMLQEKSEAKKSSISPLPLLTAKQYATVQGISRGLQNKEIAEAMDVSESTVKVHVRSVALKLGVKTREQIMAKCAHLAALSPAEYLALSGVPQDWIEWPAHEDYAEVTSRIRQRTR